MASGLRSVREPMASAGQLVLGTRNPQDLSVDDLTELATQLTDFMAINGRPGVRVTVKGDELFGAGNHFIEILEIILPNAEFIKDTVYTALLTGPVTAFMRKRFMRKHGRTRPRHVRILGPDGRLLGTLVFATTDAEPEWSEPDRE
jgi:hypothetical protein